MSDVWVVVNFEDSIVAKLIGTEFFQSEKKAWYYANAMRDRVSPDQEYRIRPVQLWCLKS